MNFAQIIDAKCEAGFLEELYIGLISCILVKVLHFKRKSKLIIVVIIRAREEGERR